MHCGAPSLVRWLSGMVVAVLVGGVLAVVGPSRPAEATLVGIDPVAWAYTDLRRPGDVTLDPEGDLPVGAWRDDDGEFHSARAYLTFDVTRFHGAEIHRAGIGLRETQATNCADRAVEMWATGEVTATTSWLRRPARRAQLEPNVGHEPTPCPATLISWLATEALREAVDAGEPSFTVEIAVPGWRQFVPDLGRWIANRAGMTVEYNFTPDAPRDLTVERLACTAEEPHPAVRMTTPELRAFFPDQDPSDRLDAYIEIWPVGDPEQVSELVREVVSNNTHAALRVPAGILGDGGQYAWRVRAVDAYGAVSPWSDTCRFSVDVTPPQHPVEVSSPDYPEETGEWLVGAGIPGTFIFDANGDTDVVSFQYRWTDLTGGMVPADVPGGSASVELAPPTAFQNTLTVRGVDQAGNVGPARQYRFTVIDTAPVATWDSADAIAGSPFPVTFTPPVDGVVAFEYWVYPLGGTEGPGTTVPAGVDGTATATLTIAESGPYFLEARSIGDGWASPGRSRFLLVVQAPVG